MLPVVIDAAVNWLKSKNRLTPAKKIEKMRLKKLQSIIQNPYLLFYDKILSFEEADFIAQIVSGKKNNDHLFFNNPARIEASITNILTLYYKNNGSFRVDKDTITRELNNYNIKINDKNNIPKSNRYNEVLGDYYLSSVFYLRKNVIKRILNNNATLVLPNNTPPEITQILKNRYCIITGPAGTGKTSLIKQIASMPFKTILTASTGKASQNLNVNNNCASTIHSVLGFGNGGFKIKRIEADIVIVDEASMLDWYTTYAIFRASAGHVILVGDKEQLPPVEGGSVFEELTKYLPTFELSKFFRYKEGVYTRLIEVEDDKNLIKKLIEIVRYFEKKQLEYQILTPLNIGKYGTKRINSLMQSVLCKSNQSLPKGYRKGDKVIVKKNCYHTDVFVYNGQIGFIKEYSDGYFWVDFGDVTVNLCSDLFNLGYAITIHKAQGSQWDYVVLILPKDLRNSFVDEKMLYTATTRAKIATIVLMV